MYARVSILMYGFPHRLFLFYVLLELLEPLSLSRVHKKGDVPASLLFVGGFEKSLRVQKRTVGTRG